VAGGEGLALSLANWPGTGTEQDWSWLEANHSMAHGVTCMVVAARTGLGRYNCPPPLSMPSSACAGCQGVKLTPQLKTRQLNKEGTAYCKQYSKSGVWNPVPEVHCKNNKFCTATRV
jgi:hypothetical protein